MFVYAFGGGKNGHIAKRIGGGLYPQTGNAIDIYAISLLILVTTWLKWSFY